MASIPEDLIVDVLSRLPVETLLRFRCVSKRWCALIDSPNFINLQLNQSLTTNNNLTLIFEKMNIDGLYSLGFDSLDDILNHDDHNIVKFEEPFLKADEFDIVGSCNGLICLISLGDNEVLTLLNPTTKKHQILPPMPPPSSEICDTVHGFGYDPVNDDYKIVNVATLFDDEVNPLGSEITVFSLKSNVWRRINHRFSNLLRPCQHGVFFNGALHWVANRQPESRVDNYIAAFDLGAENFREVQLPKDFWSVTLGVSGGCLWLFCINADDDHLDLWVMKNYMMREMSWTKHSLSFFSHVYEDLHVCQLQVLGYSKGTTQVLVQLCFNFFWLDLKQQTVVDLGFQSRGFQPLAAEIYIASLVKEYCLKDVYFPQISNCDFMIKLSVLLRKTC